MVTKASGFLWSYTKNICLCLPRSTDSSRSIAPTPGAFQRRSISADSTTGLLGLSAYKSAMDIPFLANSVMKKCIELRERISTQKEPMKILLLLDQISNEVCSVIDVAEFCRIAHDDQDSRKAAEDAFSTLSTFIHRLNTDEYLYTTLQRIVDDEKAFLELPEEHQIFAKDLKLEFESGGIHLRGQQKESADTLQQDIVASETSFIQGTSHVDDNSNFRIGPFDDKDDHHRFSSWLGQYVKQSDDQDSRTVLCSANRRISSTVLMSLDQESLRETVWLNMMGQPAKNAVVLGKLVKDRQAIAKALGYESFAHKYLANKVLKTPGEVRTLLSDIAVAVRPKAQKQLETLLSLKGTIKGRSSSNESVVLNPWDISYLMHVASSNSDTQGVNALSAVTQYFTVGSCLQGLVGITESLFGVTVKISDVRGPEAWLRTKEDQSTAIGSEQNSLGPDYHSGALKCDFSDGKGQSLGTVYLDLFDRPIKFPGAAHFSLRCGCSNTTQNFNNASIPTQNNVIREKEQYQLPIVALSFNFVSKSSSGARNTLLSLGDIETLHHEWGHALHSLLSRTTFQHLSGTRGATDFIEVPSHLFEHFARTPSVISQWARHHVTGLPIPPGMLEEALHSRKAFGAIEFQTQLLYSAADQFIFSPEIGDVSKLTEQETYNHAIHGICKLQSSLTDLPLGRPSALRAGAGAGRSGGDVYPYMFLSSHSHFVNYGGGYYSYIFAKMQAAQIWNHAFEKDPLSREGGLFLWDRMLQYGAARDTKVMLAELSGGPLQAHHFMNTL